MANQQQQQPMTSSQESEHEHKKSGIIGLAGKERAELTDEELESVVAGSVEYVGYGTEEGIDFWEVRNSTRTWWGEKKYINIK
jgi:hypothetical protein